MAKVCAIKVRLAASSVSQENLKKSLKELHIMAVSEILCEKNLSEQQILELLKCMEEKIRE